MSGRWGEKRDSWYRQAKVVGFRARSAFKLLALDAVHGLFSAVQPGGCKPRSVVDLCAAPGSWSQALASALLPRGRGARALRPRARLVQEGELRAAAGADEAAVAAQSAAGFVGFGPKSASAAATTDSDEVVIVAVDLQEIAPIPGVHVLQGDITSPATLAAIAAHFPQYSDGGLRKIDSSVSGYQCVDLVVCDGAPDVTGCHDLDVYLQAQLLAAAKGTAAALLRPGGSFVAKAFRHADASLMLSQARALFSYVCIAKPPASRAQSSEVFVVCKGFRPPAAVGGGGGASDGGLSTAGLASFGTSGDLAAWPSPPARVPLSARVPAADSPAGFEAQR